VRGQAFPPHLGISLKDDWVVLNEEVLDQHIFVLGTTGSGKSETIKRLVHEILTATDRNIYLVDGKGDEGLANDIRGLAHQHGRGKAPVFRLGFDKAGAIYDGFRGQPTDVYNRLCALVGTADAEGDAQYYADINRDLLQLICYAPAGPPRSFEELRNRLRIEWLEEAYKDDEVELLDVRKLEGRHLEGLSHRLRPLAREFSKHVGDGGFALEETPCAIFSLRVQSVGDTAQRFLDFLVEDLKDFIGKRQTRPAVLIIDEFGQFSNKNITALLSLARSAKLAIILATQDVASLKDEQTKKLVLANTRTKILMATEFPEEMAELAGTILRLENSIQFQEGEVTGRGSARVQHQFAVDPNEVAKLRPGEAFIIRQRHHAKIKVRAIGEVTHIEEQKEEVRQRKVTPAPKPEEKQQKKKAKRL
jgi:Cdc6-like AAA superfamily ATPase